MQVSRRTFLQAVPLAASVAALAPSLNTDTRLELTDANYRAMLRAQEWPFGESFVTPNGEPITAIQQVYGRLYVFTRSAIFEVPA